MIAKLIVKGPDRTAALARTADALDELIVENLVTNRTFLGKVLRHPDVVAASLTRVGLKNLQKAKLLRGLKRGHQSTYYRHSLEDWKRPLAMRLKKKRS